MLVPKVIHYIWLGSKPMHPLMVAWRKKWAELHPTWTTSPSADESSAQRNKSHMFAAL